MSSNGAAIPVYMWAIPLGLEEPIRGHTPKERSFYLQKPSITPQTGVRPGDPLRSMVEF